MDFDLPIIEKVGCQAFFDDTKKFDESYYKYCVKDVCFTDMGIHDELIVNVRKYGNIVPLTFSMQMKLIKAIGNRSYKPVKLSETITSVSYTHLTLPTKA